MNAHEAKRKASQRAFLQALETLRHMGKACQAAGVHFTTPAHWRRRYPDFREAEQLVLTRIAQGDQDDRL